MHRLVLIAGFALACSAGAPTPPGESAEPAAPSGDGVDLSIAISGEVQAELEPCG